MKNFTNFDGLPEEGKNIHLDTDVFVVNNNLSINQYTLKAFIDEFKEYVPTPHGIQAQYFVEGTELRQWMFGNNFLIHRYNSSEDAKLALKVFDLNSVNRESAPLFFYTQETANEAINEMSSEEEITHYQ